MTNIGALDSALRISDEDLDVTASAREKLGELIGQADDEIDAIRIFVSGGGCSGMNYGMTFAEQQNSLDSIIEDSSGLRIVVDPIALSYLSGAQIDFVDDGMNASFVFNNVFQAVGGSGSCGGCGGGGGGGGGSCGA
ncbi:MAG: iron-sulfur cluster insertion protein [Gammaproteobacteria bacterium]|jgi:iron-sulfur cluster insertion protein